MNRNIVIASNNLTKIVSPPGGEQLTILDSVALEVFAGESISIVGASGSGKTTLLGLLAGLDLPTTGSVQLLDHDLVALDEDERAALRLQEVGFVFQDFHLMPSLSALENVLLPMELAGREDAVDRARQLLDEVGLGQRTSHFPRQLSGGEKQRVAIARAFSTQPRILFTDEPTGNLDIDTGEAVQDLLFSLNDERGTTLVVVTHDVSLARRCQRTLRLERGALVS